MRASRSLTLLALGAGLDTAAALHKWDSTKQPLEAPNLRRAEGFGKQNSSAEYSYVVGAWVTSMFGECYNGCGGHAKQFRTVECKDVWTGDSLEFNQCEHAAQMPSTFQDCSCDMAVCFSTPEGGCPGEMGTARVPLGGYKEVACYDWNRYSADHYEANIEKRVPWARDRHHEEWACYQWSEAGECMGGLPFYRQEVARAQMTPMVCNSFCLTRGLDVFGIEFNTVCRCGVTPLNRNFWEDTPVNDRLLFHPRGRGTSGAFPCPLKVFRYNGVYEDDGLPPKYFQYDAEDQMYQDSIVLGMRIEAHGEEGGYAPEFPTAEERQSFDVALGQVGGRWKSTRCWPEVCSPGQQWTTRQLQRPDLFPSTWYQYVAIPVVFDTNLDQARRTLFRQAAEKIRAKTCINFREPLADELPEKYLTVGIDVVTKCYVTGQGMPTGDRKMSRFNMGSCANERHLGNVMHELLHVLGIGDTIQRPDSSAFHKGKGPYIQINWNNVSPENYGDFVPDLSAYMGSVPDARRWGDVDENDPFYGYAPYDFDSIMHASGQLGEFSTWPVQMIGKTGQRQKLSDGDVAMINDVYSCVAWAPDAPKHSTTLRPLTTTTVLTTTLASDGSSAPDASADDTPTETVDEGPTPAPAEGPAPAPATPPPDFQATTITLTTTQDPTQYTAMWVLRHAMSVMGAYLGAQSVFLDEFTTSILGAVMGTALGADMGRYHEDLQAAKSFVQKPEDD